MNLIAHLKQKCGVDVSLDGGRPVLDITAVKGPRWPRKLNPGLCVAIDPYGPDATRRWPVPRFEILIANLDSIGLKAVAVGVPGSDQDDEHLSRVVADFTRKTDLLSQAEAISKCILWIGHDTPRRHLAAAVGIPQLVLLPAGDETEPAYNDTVFVKPVKGPVESKALGPLSVSVAAEAVTDMLKKLGRDV
jgi:ADP-heptose:LPS heptosyltransferase